MADDEARARFECEARFWLRQGYGDAERIPALRELLGGRRSPQAIESLLEEMRRQWRRRAEWMP